MKAIILAGGFSTRLHPLTLHTPKGLLPLLGKPIAAYVMDDIAETETIDKVTLITTSLFYPQFEELCSRRYGKRISVIQNGVMNEKSRLGALGDLKYTLNETGWNDDILVATSDTISSMKTVNLLSFFEKHHGPTTVVFKTPSRATIANRLGCACLDGTRITSFEEKPVHPASNYIGVPFYIFPKKSLPLLHDYFKEGKPTDAPGAIIPWLIDKGPVYGYKMRGYYYDVGTVETYRQLNRQGSLT